MAGKKHQVAATSKGIVVSSTKPRRARMRATLLIIGVLLFLLLVSIIAYVLIHSTSKKANSPAKTTYITQAQADAAWSKRHAAEQTDLDKKLSDAKTPAEKSQVYIDLANLASAKGDMKAALSYSQQAADANPSVDAYVALGFRADQNADFKTEAYAYGKALDLLKASGKQTTDRDYQDYLALQQAAEAKL